MVNTFTFRQIINDIATLCKWRVVSLMLITAFIGMLLTPSYLWHTNKILTGISGIGLCALSGGVLNQVFESTIDQQMKRTKNRPLVTQTLSHNFAYSFAFLLFISGSIILYYCNNALSAALTISTMFGYSFIYTKWLKPRTSQNIVIGGIFGAMPPLLGWSALSNNIHLFPVLLVAIIFTWTPSHFWALSLARVEDYKQSPLPMLPITHGVSATQVHILGYGILLTLITQLPYLLYYTSSSYLIFVNILNIWYLKHLYAVYQTPKPYHSFKAFKASNIYLLLLFVTLLMDKAL